MYNILAIRRDETNLRKSEKKFGKVLEGKEKVVPLHSQNNGDEGLKKERGCRAKFFERMIQAKSER